MSRPALFVAVTALLAALLAAIGVLIARAQDADVNLWLSMGTALVVGTFVAFLILGPKAGNDADEQPAAEGFAVVEQKETRPQITPRAEGGQAPPTGADPKTGPDGAAAPAARDPPQP